MWELGEPHYHAATDLPPQVSLVGGDHDRQHQSLRISGVLVDRIQHVSDVFRVDDLGEQAQRDSPREQRYDAGTISLEMEPPPH